jgi:hypothetical protein
MSYEDMEAIPNVSWRNLICSPQKFNRQAVLQQESNKNFKNPNKHQNKEQVHVSALLPNTFQRFYGFYFKNGLIIIHVSQN